MSPNDSFRSFPFMTCSLLAYWTIVSGIKVDPVLVNLQGSIKDGVKVQNAIIYVYVRGKGYMFMWRLFLQFF